MWYKSKVARTKLPLILIQVISSSALLSREVLSNSQRKAAYFYCLWRVPVAVHAERELCPCQSHSRTRNCRLKDSISLYQCSVSAARLRCALSALGAHRPPLCSETRGRNQTKTDKTYSEIIQYVYREKMLYGQPFLENFPGKYVHDSRDFCGGNKC